MTRGERGQWFNVGHHAASGVEVVLILRCSLSCLRCTRRKALTALWASWGLSISGLPQFNDVREADDLTGVISFSEDWAKLSAADTVDETDER